MQLHDWVRLHAMSNEDAAQICGITKNTFVALVYGRRVGSVEMCAKIERATNHAVTAQDLIDAKKAAEGRTHARQQLREQGTNVGGSPGDGPPTVDDGAQSSGGQDPATPADSAEGGQDVSRGVREGGAPGLSDSERGLDDADGSEELQWCPMGIELVAGPPGRDHGPGDGTK